MFTAVLSGLPSLFRRLFLLRRGIPLPSLTSDVLGSLVLLRANQLSSPAQKRVMRLVRAAIVLGFFLTEVSGEPFDLDTVFKSC